MTLLNDLQFSNYCETIFTKHKCEKYKAQVIYTLDIGHLDNTIHFNKN